jgi:hypothetical protein
MHDARHVRGLGAGIAVWRDMIEIGASPGARPRIKFRL